MTSIPRLCPKFRILPLAVAFLGFSGSLAEASSLTLDFSNTSGTVLDASGQGTGFTSRLTNTLQSGVASTADSRLVLDTTAGKLALSGTNPGQDINGQNNTGLLEAPGILLSSLGFTGVEDFSVTAVFTNIPAEAFNNFSQFGLYVGTSTTNLTRAEFIYGFTGGTGTFLGTNTNGAGDSAGHQANSGNFSPGDTLTITISRIGGLFSQTVNGFDVSPFTDPSTFLTASDFTVGAFVLNTNGNTPFTVPLDSFSVNVVPEPGTGIMLLIGTGLFLSFQRSRKREA